MSHTEHKMGALYQTLHKSNATVTECFSLCITFLSSFIYEQPTTLDSVYPKMLMISHQLM